MTDYQKIINQLNDGVAAAKDMDMPVWGKLCSDAAAAMREAADLIETLSKKRKNKKLYNYANGYMDGLRDAWKTAGLLVTYSQAVFHRSIGGVLLTKDPITVADEIKRYKEKGNARN